MAINEQINDAIKTSLTREGFVGSLNDQLFQWLGDEGAVGDSVPERWKTYFNLKAVPAGQFNDRLKDWLALEGHSLPTLADSQLAYWRERSLAP